MEGIGLMLLFLLVAPFVVGAFKSFLFACGYFHDRIEKKYPQMKSVARWILATVITIYALAGVILIPLSISRDVAFFVYFFSYAGLWASGMETFTN